ncbi:hypothetical protein CHU00_15635 [Sphingobacterium cellulitidis]|uniref:hypothetical protein n=1 Tax=Sphingobacterium cellulitidis TaxID=1768011 RepID=UPI000B93B962|nr:hypothetical protein [Sphingobacterium cellulitidis]OYD44701.1 hypothetical protein CHU00_15635 [Sphingobacterium cellulitidis]
MIQEKLASFLGRRDETPNIELAQLISNNKDSQAVKDLVLLLKGKNKDFQNDSIKVLYEVAEHTPELISDFIQDFIDALKSKNNRLQWGAMTALKKITPINAEQIFKNILVLEQATEQGSVITRDNFIEILSILLDEKEYEDLIFPMILKQLKNCPTNQLPMYTEILAPKITSVTCKSFQETVSSRLNEIDKESKRKRIEKVLKKLNC